MFLSKEKKCKWEKIEIYIILYFPLGNFLTTKPLDKAFLFLGWLVVICKYEF